MSYLIADLIEVSRLIPVAVFGCFAAVAWVMLETFAKGKGRAEQRLDEVSNPALRREKDSLLSKKKGDAVSRMLEKASPALSAPLAPKNDDEAGKLKSRLDHAGFRGEGAVATFMTLKTMCVIAGFFLGGGGILISQGINTNTILYTAAAGLASFFLPDLFLAAIAKSRKEAIFLALPDALDLLVVCVESGLGLDQAMRKVAEEMQNAYRILAGEFAICNFHLQMGKSRNEVLHELGARTGVEDLRSLAAILIQADKFGSSIAQALRVQSDSMRTRRRQLAEERAAKTAVKLIFPLVLFIFPAIFVVLVGPAAITMVNEMLPAMAPK